MANSSFFKNTGTSTQLQGSASASAAAALASEQAALASENAAQTSETNAAASAAAALASQTAAATSAASANSDASAASISATASQTAATSSSANAALTSADATQTAADRVQTGLDRIATAADAVQTAADRVQTGLDVTSSSNSAAAALSSRNAAATSETNASASATAAAADAASTAADVISTAADAASTAADALTTAADRVQTGLDVTAASNSASAANTSASAASASQVSAAASAASAAAVFNDFEDRYYGPHATDAAAQTHVTGLGLTVDQGDLYFNSTANEMRVYDGGAFIAASSAGGASLINYHYTATASQTAFSGSDDNSNTLSYTVDNLIVTKNGIVLEVGTDYTATDGSTITLSVGAAAGDEINVVAFKSFTTADMVSATNGGTFQSNVTVNGTMIATAFSGDGSALTGITIPTLSSLGIANHDQVTVTAGGAVTATSFSGDGSSLTGIPTPTLTSLGIANHDDITVDASGNVGIGVTPASYGRLAVMTPTATFGYFGIGNSVGGGGGVNIGSFYGTTKISYIDTVLENGTPSSEQSRLQFATISGGTLTERLRIKADGTLQITSGASGANALEGSITAYNTGQAQVNSRIDFLTDAYANTGQIKLRTNFGATTKDGLVVDSLGRVTMPYQPAFVALDDRGLGQLAIANVNISQYFTTAQTNIGNGFNTSTGRFTAPIAGYYVFGWNLFTAGISADTQSRVGIIKNGNASGGEWSGGDRVGHANQGSIGIYLSANDYIVLGTQGGSYTAYWYSQAQHSRFWGYLVA